MSAGLLAVMALGPAHALAQSKVAPAAVAAVAPGAASTLTGD